MTVFRKIAPFALVFIIGAFRLFAETIVGGAISGQNIWTKDKSPYIISSDLVVMPNSTLTIQAGCVVKASYKARVFVKGVIEIRGTAAEPVLFEGAAPNRIFWGGIWIESVEGSEESIFEYCQISGSGKNGRGPIILNSSISPKFNKADFKDNLYDGIEVYNISGCDIKLDNVNAPYYALEDLEILRDKTLELSAGTVLKMGHGANIVVEGRIIAIGDFIKSVIITSIKDDENGFSDVGGDGYSEGLPGDWGGVAISGSGASILQNVEIRFGGGSAKTASSALFIDGASPKIEACSFADCLKFGVYCSGESNPDLGGGAHNSKGLNIFSGFDENSPAVNNETSAAIFAKENCWGAESSEEISKLIYDGEDANLYGSLVFEPFNISCRPEIPLAPQLALPQNKASAIAIDTILVWRPSKFASAYDVQISIDRDFSAVALEARSIEDTTFQLKNVDYNAQYYWRVRASNYLGSSPWSEIYRFKTYDTAKPSPPLPVYPNDGASDVSFSPTFRWEGSENSDYYTLQIAEDSLFSDIYFETAKIFNETLLEEGLPRASEYFWRVRAGNPNGASDWSETFFFKTSEAYQELSLPPESWRFEKQTGENSTILLRAADAPRAVGRKLKTGDAIGAFFTRTDSLVCGGYAFWEEGKNVALTVWGDNKQTPEIKDGFDRREKLRFKIWRSRAASEKPTEAEYSSGYDYFFPDTLAIIKSFDKLDYAEMSSSPGVRKFFAIDVEPFNPSLKQTFGESVNLNDDKIRRYPQKNIFELSRLENSKAYMIYSEDSVYALVEGSRVSNASTPILFQSKRPRLAPYLLDYPTKISDAFAECADNLIACVSWDGRIFAPRFRVNQIGVLAPGDAFRAVFELADTLVYPQADTVRIENISDVSLSHFNIDWRRTGRFAVIFLESSDLSLGDEIAAFNQNGETVAAGKASDGFAAFAVWGDNEISSSIDGAIDGEELVFRSWSKRNMKEYEINIIESSNLLSGEKGSDIYIYKNDEIWLIKAKSKIITDVIDEIPINQYNKNTFESRAVPNPAGATISFYYNLEHSSNIDLSIWNSFGKEISYSKIGFKDGTYGVLSVDIGSQADGIYFYRLVCGGKTSRGKFLKID